MLHRTLILLAVVLSGCVAAYDPTSPGRLGLETRAQETGIKEARPWTRGRRVAPKPAPAPMAAAPQPVPAQPSTPAAAPSVPPTLAATDTQTPVGKQFDWWLGILRGGDVRRMESHFADAFLAKVPAAQVREVARTWRRDQLNDGPVELVKIDDATPTSLTAIVRGTASGRYSQIRMGVDEEGRISALWLGPLVGYKDRDLDTWAKIEARLASFPGSAALGIYQLNGGDLVPVRAVNAAAPLAIGSTFKLYVLGALAEEVQAGRVSWDEPLAISDDHKSLPSGQMQLEPEGAEFPISRYAELMISISDNTATDHLIARIGRERVEAYMQRLNPDAARSLPFLSTMEMFKLKLSPDRALAPRYGDAGVPSRRAMLAEGGDVRRASPSTIGAAMWKLPYEIHRIEWFASAESCCRVMADLHRLERMPGMTPVGRALRLNPGLQFDAKVWPGIAYKGGSEPGVLNMTWLLTRDDERRFLVSFGWNDPAKDVDLKQAADLVSAAVALTAEEGRPAKP